MEGIKFLIGFLLSCLWGCDVIPYEEIYGEADYTTPQGVEVAYNNHWVDPVEVTHVISDTAHAWRTALEKDHVACNLTRALDVVHISFQPLPFTDVYCQWEDGYGCMERLAGLARYHGFHGWWLQVGFTYPESQTALGHELGHVFATICLNRPTEEGLKAYVDLHPDIPY